MSIARYYTEHLLNKDGWWLAVEFSAMAGALGIGTVAIQATIRAG